MFALQPSICRNTLLVPSFETPLHRRARPVHMHPVQSKVPKRKFPKQAHALPLRKRAIPMRKMLAGIQHGIPIWTAHEHPLEGEEILLRCVQTGLPQTLRASHAHGEARGHRVPLPDMQQNVRHATSPRQTPETTQDSYSVEIVQVQYLRRWVARQNLPAKSLGQT